MLKAFFTSATGMRAQEMLIDNSANNLANLNTTGFKRSHMEFADLIYDVSRNPGAQTASGQIAPIGLQVGNGVRALGTTNIYSQGSDIHTGSPTHMAIQGEGFFKVTLPDGSSGYTRDGSFLPNAQGQLTNANGQLLDPAITIPQGARDITISEDGTVSYVAAGATTTSIAGQIQLARFPNPAGLKMIGGNILVATDASGAEVLGTPGDQGVGKIRSGSLEGSNVEVVSELVSLITAQRAYEINSRAIRAGDEMLSNTSQLVR